MSKEVTCPRCKGKGTIYKDYLTHGKEEQCTNCKGTGTIRK